jgi:iron complex transport system substrate-binding protein
VTLTDDEGTQITIPSEPRRIVSLTPAATEILFAIGAGDRVAAKVEDITPWPPEAADLPIVATFQGVQVEKIVELNADLAIAGGVAFTDPEAVAQLRRLGIPVIVVYADSTAGAFRDIELIGDAVGEGAAARDLTASMGAAFDQVEAATAGLPKPRVFYEIDATSKIYTPAEGSVYAEVLRLAGSEPLLTDTSYEISLEEIVEFDPEIILLGNPFATPDQVRERPGWSGIGAVRNGRIIPVNDTIITRPGPRLVDGLRELARALHPDLDLPEASALPVPSAAGG